MVAQGLCVCGRELELSVVGETRGRCHTESEFVGGAESLVLGATLAEFLGRTVVDSNAHSVDVVWLEEVVIDRHHCHLGDEIGERDAVRVRYTPRERVAGEVGDAVACVVEDGCHKLLLLGHIKLVVVLVRLREDAQLQKHVALRHC